LIGKDSEAKIEQTQIKIWAFIKILLRPITKHSLIRSGKKSMQGREWSKITNDFGWNPL